MNNRMRLRCGIASMGVVLAAGWAATANPVDLAATNRGWVSQDSDPFAGTFYGVSGTGPNESYEASFFTSASSIFGHTAFRNWFVFDLTGLSSPITSAELRLDAGTIVGTGAYDLKPTSSSPATLIAGGGGQTVWVSLAPFSAPLFSSISFEPTMSNTTLTLALNAAGLAYVNANLGGQIAFSGETIGVGVRVFGSTASASTTLHLVEDPGNPAIPLPTGAAMAMVGMGVIGVRRRRN
jgi:hypothetical protein